MILELFNAAIICGGLIKDKIEQNQPYYGTDRDIFRNNPKVQENRKTVDDIIARQKAEYIKKHGHSW